MKKVGILALILVLCGCIEVGKFTPERHALHEYGKPNCEHQPDRCINGVAW
ncbi:MAG: hypothetical protein IJ529_01270 [Alphaproteobacteria bacterium]|nr:hypothetical protein [Alphaproteobacteria bacterium]MBQ9234924.1 hypothetical protein [Alphaproteobacteria bacterium]